MYVVKTTPCFQVGAHNGVPALEVRHPIRFSCDRIDRNSPKIAGIHKVLQRFWTLLLVQGVVIDRVPYSPQVRSDNQKKLWATSPR
jgi:hypothetical protein